MELRDVDVILLDGRSGSGKSALATQIAARLANEGGLIQVLQVEDLYPGWNGLAAGSEAVAQALDTLEYRRYDWHAGAFAEIVQITLTRPLVIEGCGALTQANLEAAQRWAARARSAEASRAETNPAVTNPAVTNPAEAQVHAIWLECETSVRRDRALGRDGDVFVPHWDAWAAQEDALYRRTDPASLADEILVSSAPQAAADAARAAWSVHTAG